MPFDWLIAMSPSGFLCGSTAAHDSDVETTFTHAHERAGCTITRLTFQEARDRLAACRAPARELYYPPRPAAPIAPKPETAASLPAVTEQVMALEGAGIVMSHLRWPDHHPTHAGRVATHVVGDGFEALAYPGQAKLYCPPPAPSPKADLPSDPVSVTPPLPLPSQPSLF